MEEDPKQYVGIERQLWQELMVYLSEKPYKEVSGLINQLQTNSSMISVKEEAEDSE